MKSLIFALNAVTPIIIMVLIGYFLKKIGFMKPEFSKAANKLVFRVFLPAMLFLNVYRIENIAEMNFGYALYAVVSLLILTAVMTPVVILFTAKKNQRGVLLQSIFRSNYALIGIPLASALFGEDGIIAATLLSAVIVPVFNVLAVVCLSIFKEGETKVDFKGVFVEILKNPLIQSIAAGLVVLGIRALFVKWGFEFRLTDITPLEKVLNYLSNMATPMALIVLGAQFDFSAVSSMKREIIFGSLLRTVIVPVLGLGIAYLLFRDSFGGAEFAALVAMFATPVAVSSVPMAQEMDADVTLAGQLVVWTTILSSGSIFLSSYLLKLAGIF